VLSCSGAIIIGGVAFEEIRKGSLDKKIVEFFVVLRE
jgi:hypothetical protein